MLCTIACAGDATSAGFPKDKSQMPEDNPEYSKNTQAEPQGKVSSASGANVSYDEVVEAQLGGGEKKLDTDKA